MHTNCKSDIQYVVVVSHKVVQCTFVIVVERQSSVSTSLLPLGCFGPRLLYAFSHLLVTSRQLFDGNVEGCALIIPRMLFAQKIGNIRNGRL